MWRRTSGRLVAYARSMADTSKVGVVRADAPDRPAVGESEIVNLDAVRQPTGDLSATDADCIAIGDGHIVKNPRKRKRANVNVPWLFPE